MNDTTKACVTIVACVALVCALFYGLMESYTRRVVAAMENGYEEGTVPGITGASWVKADGGSK